MNSLQYDKEYQEWIKNIKLKIRQRQIKAAISVNTELILLYWDLGKMIVEKQKNADWGNKVIEQLSKDLKQEFPDLNGFSRTNLYNMRKFYLFYNQDDKFVRQIPENIKNKFVHLLGGQIENSIITKIPWKHHILITEKVKNIQEALFYLNETIANNWSKSVLEYQIETNLFKRQGKTINNFENTLPKPESDLAKSIFKDPYNFIFFYLSKKAKEKDLENKLVENISRFLLELGKGFAYMGKQFLLKVGSKEFRIDLLFYHVKLRSYIVIELKMQEFEPEFIGKLGFYVTAINETVKTEFDNPTIGILLCKTKDNLVVDFALKDMNKPIGVSEFTYNELPENIKNELPTAEQFKNEIQKITNK